MFCVNMPLASRIVALLSVGLLCSCANVAGRMAGTMKVTASKAVLLRLESGELANLQLQVWNRGPNDVRFEQVEPGPSEQAKGVLRAKGREFHWQATTKHLELKLTVAEGEGRVGYVVRSDRAVNVTVSAK